MIFKISEVYAWLQTPLLGRNKSHFHFQLHFQPFDTTMYAPPLKLNLVVIRSPDIDRAAYFYRALGLLITKHSHGTGPEHYSSEVCGFVFEIYPLAEGQSPTTAARVGFVVDDVDSLIRLVTEAGATVISAPQDSIWGRRAVVKDLDGHSVELVSQLNAPTTRP